MFSTVASRAKKARKEAGLTQNELAKKSKTAQGVISDIENGRNKTSSALFDIASATGVRYEWLIRNQGEMYATKDDSQGLGDRPIDLTNVRQVPVLTLSETGTIESHKDTKRKEPIMGDYPDKVESLEYKLNDNS